MIPAEIFHRVVHLFDGEFVATGTIIHVDGREYIATARHFAELLKDRVQIFYEGKWTLVGAEIVGHSDEADVSVLALAGAIVPLALEIGMTTTDLIFGQEVYFMGFPFGFSGHANNATRNFPIPFVKKAIVSNFETQDPRADFWLDGHNNVGFSGGPIVSLDRNSSPACVLRGFVCSYYTDQSEIDGPQDENGGYRANSGLVIAAKVERALELVAANPCGPRVGAMHRIYPLLG